MQNTQAANKQSAIDLSQVNLSEDSSAQSNYKKSAKQLSPKVSINRSDSLDSFVSASDGEINKDEPKVILPGFSGAELSSTQIKMSAMNVASMDKAFGDANEYIEVLAKKIFDKYKSKKMKTSRWTKMKNTLSFATTKGASVGAAVAKGALTPYDMVVGTGSKPSLSDGKNLSDQGLLSLVLKVVSELLVKLLESLGGALGGVGGAITLPARISSENSTSQDWIKSSATKFKDATGKAAAQVFGTMSGLTVASARLPSIIIKFILSALCGTGGGFFGSLVGIFRSIFNI